ncbi:hypothetical protein OIO90_000756 [Microbotryomycetes sp. JL221]|nr:hypothetical protein OIO90_000756 [Microbotryomycetes sp. JL221]
MLVNKARSTVLLAARRSIATPRLRLTAANSRAASARSISTSSSLVSNSCRNYSTLWTSLALATASLAWLITHLKPDLVTQSLIQLEADTESHSNEFVDPTSKLSFPTTILSPSGKTLHLIGTGVRTVSFLGIRVYTAGFYVDQQNCNSFLKQNFSKQPFQPNLLLPPFPKQTNDLFGEKLIDQMLETTDVAIVIVPLRSTNLPHLRDGFARGLLARLKLPHVTSSMTEAENQAAPVAITEMRSLFPSRALPKGAPLELFYSASTKQIQFQSRNSPNGSIDVLGQLTHSKLSKELVLSYFSDTLETSIELRKSVAQGLAGEPR